MGIGSWGDINRPNEEIASKTSGISIETDLRVIKASTGEVVWRKIVTGENTKTLVRVDIFKFGSAKLTADVYNQALADAATKISDAMIEDLKAHRLFTK